tara:strand:+ start:3859 stop:4746 length:888 start_codon:yes stop_codon:yes gene_type:complete
MSKIVEEFHDAEEYISDDKIYDFDIKDYIIHPIDDSKYLVKLTAKQFARFCDPWVYNRKINTEKVGELKEQFKVFDKSTSPIWNVSLVFDKYTHKSKDDIPKYIKILDGQHRWQLVKDLLEDGEIDANYEIYATCYIIDYCEENNKNITTELFKKINNNTPLCIDDIPDTRIQELVDKIIEDKELNPKKEGIKIGIAQKTAIEPAIHKKELFNILNTHSKSFSHLSQDEIITNLRLIKNRIMLKEFKEIYHKCDNNVKRYKKAESADFWLGLKSSKKFSPEKWVLFISNPQEFGK